jgi:hypothetical protein
MIPVSDECDDVMKVAGIDQGIHNLLLQRQSPARMQAWLNYSESGESIGSELFKVGVRAAGWAWRSKFVALNPDTASTRCRPLLEQLPPYLESPNMLTGHHGLKPNITVPPRRRKLLETIQRAQRQLSVLEAAAEDGVICTMALLLKHGVTRDRDGFVTARNPSLKDVRCAIVHQFDRSAELNEWYSRKYVFEGG